MALTCLDTLVGLANRDCPCTSGGERPSGWNTSDSSYFLTDREYGFQIKDALFANVDCGEDSIWDVLGEARTQAIRDMKSDLQQLLNDTRESRVINWRGLIGKADATSSYLSTKTTVGFQLRPKYRLRDADFIVKAIYIGLDTTKTFNVTISSNSPDFSDQVIPVTATAGQFVRNELSTAVTLPLYQIATDDLKYNVHYAPGGALPKRNKTFCCSAPPWMNHLEANGFETDTLDDDDKATIGSAYGIAIEGYFTCNKLDWICNLSEMNGLDFRDLVGRCIQYKGAIKLISSILESDRVNFYTLLEPEALYRRRSMLGKLYSENLLWIAQNLPPNITSCWGCEKAAPKVDAILV